MSYHRCDVPEHGDLEAKSHRAEVAIEKLRNVVEAFGVESTRWQKRTGVSGRATVTGSSPGLAIPEDCDSCEVTIDADVYEAVLDLLAASPAVGP